MCSNSLVEEQGVVGLSTLNEPSHGLDHIRSRGDLTGIARIVCENDNVFRVVSVPL